MQLTTNDGADIRFCRNFPNCASTSISSLELNQWQHVVGTADGTNCRLYINANLIVTDGCSGTGSGTTRIGEHSAGGRAFNGLIDDVRIYDRALSASEIERLYNMGR